jgi:hypothetical protein
MNTKWPSTTGTARLHFLAQKIEESGHGMPDRLAVDWLLQSRTKSSKSNLLKPIGNSSVSALLPSRDFPLRPNTLAQARPRERATALIEQFHSSRST